MWLCYDLNFNLHKTGWILNVNIMTVQCQFIYLSFVTKATFIMDILKQLQLLVDQSNNLLRK